MIKKISLIFAVVLPILLMGFVNYTESGDYSFQQPTIAIPTVTGTPQGVMAYVDLNTEDPINVRSGPGVFYDEIGVLLPGESVPVIGRSAGGDWLLVEYPGVKEGSGWIYSPLVSISPGELQIIEPPSTPTPEVTETIDPTLAAQFVTTPVSTNLPTYTPAPPQNVPVYSDEVSSGFSQHLPIGLIILIVGGLGVLIAVISLFTEH